MAHKVRFRVTAQEITPKRFARFIYQYDRTESSIRTGTTQSECIHFGDRNAVDGPKDQQDVELSFAGPLVVESRLICRCNFEDPP